MENQPSDGHQLSATDNVARYCGFEKLREDGLPSPAAFLIEEGHDFLSTVWLEYFHDSDRVVQISGARDALAVKLRLGARAKIATLNVGEAVTVCKQQGNIDIEVRLTGESHDPSHAGIHGYNDPANNARTAAILARLARRNPVYPAR